jgi:hypothetical protein
MVGCWSYRGVLPNGTAMRLRAWSVRGQQ